MSSAQTTGNKSERASERLPLVEVSVQDDAGRGARKAAAKT